jgi:predicted N-acetyltransferase YhbS
MQPQIEQLAERPDLLPIVAAWIYHQWWTTVEGASVNTLADLLRGHLVHDEIPLTFVASLDRLPIGTATLMAHDVGTEQWPDLSPWLAALYVQPDYRRRGVGGALVSATVSKARALGARVLYLSTVDREDFYAQLGWQVVDRSDRTVVMSKPTENQP